jgi:peptidoglycan/xylan/chitin deacetylase (PgdA/CDA1 family)
MQLNSGARDIVADRPRPVEAPAIALRRIAAACRWAPFAATLVPAAAIAGSPVHASALSIALAVAVSLACAAGAAARAPYTLITAVAGVCVAAACIWVLTQASYAALGVIVAPALGAAAGLSTAGHERAAGGRFDAAIAGAAALALVAIRWSLDRDAMAVAAVAVVALPALLSIAAVRPRAGGRLAAGVAAAVLALGAGTVAYAGATTPSAGWFGALVSHGPRDQRMVAITFDDGPDPPYTLEVARVLDDRGVKGTFFTVGKALEARPDISRALLADGHLLANHSYHHDAVRWLDPSYGELGSTQDAFKRTLGVCPAFFRPPHGTHTPFMTRQADQRGMTVVTWDVSAADWATDDPALVARRVLDKVRPGSIILLHDGLDGHIGADRSVVVAALPMILDGLRERGLQPVTLDKLLGRPGYVERC